jgi:hypothetical protein
MGELHIFTELRFRTPAEQRGVATWLLFFMELSSLKNSRHFKRPTLMLLEIFKTNNRYITI